MRKYLIFLTLMITSCSGTWLMYDTDQKDRLYFTVQGSANVVSFALMVESEYDYSAKINILGTPKPYDRTFSVQYLPASEGETIFVGGEEVPVCSADKDTDFSAEGFVIPAGEVASSVTVHLHRNPSMTGIYKKVHFKVLSDDEFLPMDPDSTSTKAIITPEFVLYVTDGEPSCPEWWITESHGVDYQWGAYYGIFTPAKYRKMLEYYHGIAEKNPSLYLDLVEKYGFNIDKEGLQRNFMSMQEQSVWATYVLIPLHAYYQEYYKTHPDEAENFGNTGDLTTLTWGDPMRLLR